MRIVVLASLLWGCAAPVARPTPSATPSSALPDAVAHHDFEQVKALVAHGADVNGRDAEGHTALFVALTAYSLYWHPHGEDQEDVLAYLLKHGADPNLSYVYGNVEGVSVLQLAAYDGRVREVKLLVEHGADVNHADSRGMTAAHEAAVCDFRLNCDECGDVPGHPPVGRWGAKPVLEYLVAHGADLRKKTKRGDDVLATVPTPCGEPGVVCTPESLARVEWHTGECRATWEYVYSVVRAK